MGEMDGKCQVCGTVLARSGEGVVLCPTCKEGAHEECWTHLGGCVSPECRKASREAQRESTSGGSVVTRRREALVRRRLGWIMANEMGIVPEYHPEEARLRAGTVVCAILTVVLGAYGLANLAKIFGGCALFVCALLWVHKNDRKAGRVHRWIPADRAPAVGLKLADWVLVLEASGGGGIPLADFGREYLGEPDDRKLLDEVTAAKYVEIREDAGGKTVLLAPAAVPLVDEARSREAPELARGTSGTFPIP